MKRFKPKIKELKELGFKYSDVGHYILEITENDVYGFRFPCLVNYFPKKNLFLMGAAFYFLPDSIDDLKVIIRIFGKNVNIYKTLGQKK